jgi:hypothetical protein
MKTLSLNILDIVQNSIRAKASEVTIEIEESVKTDLFRITISDNGTGIPPELLEKITDPFVTTRTKRKMGLGLSLLKYHAYLTGGNLRIESEAGKGTVIMADFFNSHIDRQPLGDIAGVLIIILMCNPPVNLSYRHSTDSGEYRFSSAETKEFLEVENLNENTLLQMIKGMIIENLSNICVSGLKSN